MHCGNRLCLPGRGARPSVMTTGPGRQLVPITCWARHARWVRNRKRIPTRCADPELETTMLTREEDLAARLARLREQAGMSVAALAGRAGLHRDYIYRLQRGEREPSLAVAKVLARALGVTLGELAGVD